MDVEILARIQFAFTIAFHYIYPPLSIGIGLLMVVFEGKYLWSKDEDYHILARFWTKIFALTFGIGVVTGIVMEFEFGTNWATYSKFVGDIFGSALASEGIFAFALESGFLGIVLFGWNKVKPWVHFSATLGVFLGSMFSAVWIVVANSWQQTPTGYKIVAHNHTIRAEITDFWAMVFNPSSVDRVLHVWIGAFLSGIFLVLSVHAYYLIRKKHEILSQKAMKITMYLALVFSLSQLFLGHRSAEIVAEYQPAKLAALEGHFEANAPADMYLLGWVNKEKQEVTGLGVPGGLSFLLHQDFDAPVIGLNSFEPKDRPSQVNAVFQFYHLMVLFGMILIGLAVLGVYFMYKKILFTSNWFLWILVFATLLPQLANQFGWYAAEMGRQPWVVYGLLRTNEAFSQAVTANQVLFSLILFAFVYLILFILFIYLLTKKIKNGPHSTHSIEKRPNQEKISQVFTK